MNSRRKFGPILAKRTATESQDEEKFEINQAGRAPLDKVGWFITRLTRIYGFTG